jgi:hypothetical protein
MLPLPGARFDFAQAFPGWSGYVGADQSGLAWYNNLPLSTAGFSIIDRSFFIPPGAPGGVIQGNFTAVVASGVSGVQQSSDTSLRQTSLVPVAAESLQFRALFNANGGNGSYFSVSLGGQTLSLVSLVAGTNYTVYGADIHDWAGQTAELAFTSHTNLQWYIPGYLYLDSIQFSSQPVPEPSIAGVWGIGALLVGWHSLQRRRHGFRRSHRLIQLHGSG